MVEAANAFAARGITVATFDFPYMAQGRSVPDKAPVLEAHWRDGDRRGTRGIRRSPACRSSSAASRWAAGSRRRSPRSTSTASPDWSISAIRCIRRAGPSSAAIGICRTSASRCSSSRGRAISSAPPTRSARCCPRLNPRATLFEVQDGDHSFKVRVKVTGKKQDGGAQRDLRHRRRVHPDMRELNVPVTTHGRVLIDDADDAAPLRLLVGCHGYGQSADEMHGAAARRSGRRVVDARLDPGAAPLLPRALADDRGELDDAPGSRAADRRQRRLRGRGDRSRAAGRGRSRGWSSADSRRGSRWRSAPACSARARRTRSWRSAATCRRSCWPMPG